MAKSKKPRKAYRPRGYEPAAGMRLQPWKLSKFAPMELILARLETGKAFDVNNEGKIRTHYFEAGQSIAVDEMIDLWTEIFVIAGIRAPGICAGVAPLQRPCATLAEGDALTQADIDACRTCLEALRRYTERLPSAELLDLARTVALKAEMDDCDALKQAV